MFFPFKQMTFKELNAMLDNGEIKKMQQSNKRKIEPAPESEEEVDTTKAKKTQQSNKRKIEPEPEEEVDTTKAKDSTQQSDTKKPKFGLLPKHRF